MAETPSPRDPVPFSIFATPPVGSLGDRFDGRMALPKPLALGTEAIPLMAEGGPRKLVVFEQKVHWLLPAAWVLLALGFASTGPLMPLAPMWFLAASLAAGVAVLLLKFTLTFSRGTAQGVGVALAAIIMLFFTMSTGGVGLPVPGTGKGLVALPSLVNDDRFAMMPEDFRNRAGRSLSAELEVEATVLWMRQVARLAGCCYRSCSEAEVLRPYFGAESSHHPPDPEYRFMPALDVNSRCVHQAFIAFKIEENRYYQSSFDEDTQIRQLFAWTKDPFSPYGQAPFGVVVRGTKVMVWSIGPDQRLDFNPVRVFRPDNPEWQDPVIPLTYDPTNGAGSSGDLWIVHEFAEDDCPDITFQGW